MRSRPETPSIRVRTHQLEHGSFVMDPRSLGQGERDRVAERLIAAIGEASRNRGEGVQAWKLQRANAIRLWPDMQTEAAS